MGKLTKYRVVLNGTVMPNEQREDVIQALCELFHSRPAYMEKLLTGNEVPLKKQYHKSEAKSVCRAVRAAGAQCKLVPVGEKELQVIEDDGSTISTLSHPGLMLCPDCNQECDPDWESCQYCGSHSIRSRQNKRIEEHSGFENSEFSTDVSATPDEELREEKREEKKNGVGPAQPTSRTLRFVGSNVDYYANRFELFGSLKNPKFRVTWHWPAFFAFFLWALYRKMWAWAAIFQLSWVLMVSFTTPSPLWMIFLVAWPLCANYLYFRHVGFCLDKMGQNQTEEEQDTFLVTQGGVSKLALWLGVAVSIMLMIYSGSKLTATLLQVYEAQYGKDVSQMRGDGSVLRLDGDQNSALAKTSLVIEKLATATKILIATGSDTEVNAKLDALIAESKNEKFRDSWGNPIFLQRNQDIIVILSPGPDGREKTDDDIVKFLNY